MGGVISTSSLIFYQVLGAWYSSLFCTTSHCFSRLSAPRPPMCNPLSRPVIPRMFNFSIIPRYHRWLGLSAFWLSFNGSRGSRALILADKVPIALMTGIIRAGNYIPVSPAVPKLGAVWIFLFRNGTLNPSPPGGNRQTSQPVPNITIGPTALANHFLPLFGSGTVGYNTTESPPSPRCVIPFIFPYSYQSFLSALSLTTTTVQPIESSSGTSYA